MAIIHSLKCTVPFSFVVPLLSLALIHCHLLPLVVTRCITLSQSLYHSFSLVVIRCHSLYHSLSLFITRCTTCCHSLSFVVTRCHSLSLVVPLVVTRCHSLSLVVPLVVTHCHSLSLVVIRCTTRLSFYKRSFIPLNVNTFEINFLNGFPVVMVAQMVQNSVAFTICVQP